MSLTLYDRISGSTAAPSTGTSVLGRWQILREQGQDVYLNTIPVSSSDALVPDATARWDLHVGGTGARSSGTFSKSQLAEGTEADGILAVGRSLDELIRGGAVFADWVAQPPLVPGISEHARLQPLEHAIREHLPALEEVCRRPRSHLRAEVERTPVARARRLPANAPTYLAAHTEDWQRPTLRGVQPRRVLSIIHDEQWNIYENRVAARLADHLRAYLAQRANELRRLQRIFDDAHDHSADVGRGSLWRRRRMAQLWGQTMQADEGHRLVASTAAEIGRLQRRVAKLLDSLLYREVPRNAAVPVTLTQTNIFVNDPGYRRVATLWRSWSSQASSQPKSPRQVFEEKQSLCRGFDSFCVLLVLRALEQLRYKPSGTSAPIERGAHITLEGPDGPLKLTWSDEGVIQVNAAQSLRIIPLAAELAASGNEDELREQMQDMERATPERAVSLVLYLKSNVERFGRKLDDGLRWRIHSLRGDGREATHRELWFLPVSPWDLGSVERVARAIRRVSTGPRLLAYPPQLPALPEGIEPRSIHGWIERGRDARYRLVRLPQNGERKRAEFESLARMYLSEQRELEQRERQHQQRKPADAGRELSRWNAEKSELRLKREAAASKHEKMDRFAVGLSTATHQFELLLRCPVCPEEAPGQFEPGDEDTFRCRCTSCRASWGLRTCGGCSGRFAFLLPKLDPIRTLSGDAGWIDEQLGCDVLAAPCGHGQFICPSCGDCSCSPRAT
ncbi:hypothetical protein WME99_05760 [Sorangium sp. So ce136]|uniref:hypothetical protein n=1 Tax=Sorangium sp. So ce136 TaxID=3133284 RepID=UPI003F027372